ncbi:UNVERIFIED_CONTAM: hypothetical protein FKN15_075229 [Acipenser sinensis]
MMCLVHYQALSCLSLACKLVFIQGKLDGRIQNPSASDLVHVLFPALSFIMSHCPEPDLPASILSPLLIQPALELLENNVTPDEQRLWKSLGEAWNLPRSLWPDADSIPPYIPEFSDGWEPPVPEPTRNLERDHRDRQSQRSSRTVPEQQPNSDLRSFPPIRANEQPHFMRVMYDFMARNSQELSIMKGEILLVLDKSRKWFRARNIREEEGFVPNNVLEPLEEEEEEHNVYQVHNLTLLRNTLRHCVHRQSDASPSLSHLHEPACRGRAGRSLQQPAHPGLAFGNAGCRKGNAVEKAGLI